MCGGGNDNIDFNDDNSKWVAEENARRKREAQKDIITAAEKIKSEAISLSKFFSDESDTKSFLVKLSAYIEMRSKNTSWDADYLQIDSRAGFILKCLNAISAAKTLAVTIPSMGIDDVIKKNIELIKKEMTKLNNYLAEDSIKPFKGCFSQKMYDMLTISRNCLFNRKPTIQNALSSVLPVQVINIVGKYDENGDILNNEILEAKSLKP